MDEAQTRIPLSEAVYKHGFRRTCRDANVTRWTLTHVVRGESVPKQETAERIAGALGLELEEVEWPRGYSETVQGSRVMDVPRVTPDRTPSVRPENLDRIYFDERFKQAAAREVRHQLATAQQRNAERIAAQSNNQTESVQS